MSEVTQRLVDEILLSTVSVLTSERLAQIKDDLEESPDFEQAALKSVEKSVEKFFKKLETKEPQPQFNNVVEFVEKFLSKLYPYTEDRERDVKWTRYWWKHQEAVFRLTGLWHRYEQLRINEPSTYTETFLRVYADYHMRQLMAVDGVFDSCRREDSPSIPLPTEPLQKKEKTEA